MRVKFVRVAVTATAFGVASVALSAPAHAEDRACDTGAFCVYEDPDYAGKWFEIATNKPDWSTGSASAALMNKDSSWRNRYQSWYWGCVYNYNSYSDVTVWVPRGGSYPRAQSGQRVNLGNSNRGLASSASC